MVVGERPVVGDSERRRARRPPPRSPACAARAGRSARAPPRQEPPAARTRAPSAAAAARSPSDEAGSRDAEGTPRRGTTRGAPRGHRHLLVTASLILRHLIHERRSARSVAASVVGSNSVRQTVSVTRRHRTLVAPLARDDAFGKAPEQPVGGKVAGARGKHLERGRDVSELLGSIRRLDDDVDTAGGRRDRASRTCRSRHPSTPSARLSSGETNLADATTTSRQAPRARFVSARATDLPESIYGFGGKCFRISRTASWMSGCASPASGPASAPPARCRARRLPCWR